MLQTRLLKPEPVDWPEHAIPARLERSQAARVAAKGAKALGPSGKLAARVGAREVIIQRSAPDDSSHTGTPPEREAGDIRGFSDSSKTRMRQTLQRLSREANGLFLTLTWHTRSVGGREVKRCLHAMIQAMRRRWKGVKWGAIWRLEYQKRGTPHLHLLIEGIRFEHMDWFKKVWHRITNEPPGDHERCGSFVKRWPKGSKMSSYCAKYMAKPMDPFGGWQGRVWGVRNRQNLPFCDVDLVIDIPYQVAQDLALAVWRSWGLDDKPCPYSLRIWAEDPKAFINRLLQEYDTYREAV
jgi:hypothetical protein